MASPGTSFEGPGAPPWATPPTQTDASGMPLPSTPGGGSEPQPDNTVPFPSDAVPGAFVFGPGMAFAAVGLLAFVLLRKTPRWAMPIGLAAGAVASYLFRKGSD